MLEASEFDVTQQRPQFIVYNNNMNTQPTNTTTNNETSNGKPVLKPIVIGSESDSYLNQAVVVRQGPPVSAQTVSPILNMEQLQLAPLLNLQRCNCCLLE